VAGQSRNAEEENHLSVPEILQYSTSAWYKLCKIKPAVYYNWMERLGLKQTVAIDLPSEVSGQLKSKAVYRFPIEPATASFGQDFL